MNHARSLLFVPADRPERYAKALTSGADLICIDLEDAVAPDRRAAARQLLADALPTLETAAEGTRRVGVRINGLHTRDGLLDLVALQGFARAPAFVMLAKCDDAAQVRLIAAQNPGVALIALIETAIGLQQAAAIAAAHPQLQALMLGGADLSAELGSNLSFDALLHARSALVAAAALANLACIDVPWLDIADAAGAGDETRRIAALGMSAKGLIHPSQVAPVHAAFRPSDAAIERARAVVQAAAGSAGAVQLDGRMIDRPVVLAAQRLLRRIGG